MNKNTLKFFIFKLYMKKFNLYFNIVKKLCENLIRKKMKITFNK